MSEAKIKEFLANHIENMKRNIQINTFRGFLLSMTATFLLGIAVLNLQKKSDLPIVISFPQPELIAVNIETDSKTKQNENKSNITIEQKITKKSKNVILKKIDGTIKVAGKFKAVNDKISINLSDIATFDESAFMSSELGDIKNLKELFKDTRVEITTKNHIEKEIEEVVPIFEVEKAPIVNLNEIQRNIKYPNLAMQANIEGKVVVEVLVSRNGKPLECSIIYSDNPLFDEAAISAIMNTSFEPAYQNGLTVNCKINIPISFKLR